MGIMDRLLGEPQTGAGGGEYVELDPEAFDVGEEEVSTSVHVATIEGQHDVIAIKDAIYSGDIVIADLTRHTTSDRTIDRITEDLREVVEEVGGDIVQKADDQLIITPGAVGISRTKLGR